MVFEQLVFFWVSAYLQGWVVSFRECDQKNPTNNSCLPSVAAVYLHPKTNHDMTVEKNEHLKIYFLHVGLLEVTCQ